MTQHGGKRPGSGRPPGRKNRATIEHKATLEELARTHTEFAIATLVEIAVNGETDSARVSAINAILDRGYGKPKQGVEMSGPGGGPIETADMSQARLASALAELPEGEREALRPLLAKLTQ